MLQLSYNSLLLILPFNLILIIFFFWGLGSLIVSSFNLLIEQKTKRYIAFLSPNSTGFLVLFWCSLCNEWVYLFSISHISIQSFSFAFLFGFLSFFETKNEIPVSILYLRNYAEINFTFLIFFILVLFSLIGIPPFPGFFLKLGMLFYFFQNKSFFLLEIENTMGALTIKKYAFQFRPWELESQIIKNIFSFFPENIVLYYKNKQLIRILPEFNNQFISNRIRFLKVKQKSNLNYFNLYFLGYSLLSKFKFFKILTGFKLHFFYIHGFDYKQNFLVFNSIFENFEKNLQIFNKNTDFSFLEGTAVFIGQFLSLVSLVFNKLIDRKTFLFGKLKQNYAVLFKKSSLYLECFFFFSHEVVYINNDNIQNQNAALY